LRGKDDERGFAAGGRGGHGHRVAREEAGVRRRRALQVEIAMALMAWFVRISDAAMGGGEEAKEQAVVLLLHAQPKSGYPLQNSTDHRWADAVLACFACSRCFLV